MKRLFLIPVTLLLYAALPSCKTRGASPTLPEAVVISSGTIGVGGSLSDSLGNAGVPPLESAQVERTLKPLFNPRYSKAQDKYEVQMSTTGHLVQMTYWPNSFQYFTVKRSTDGVFSASTAKVNVDQSM